MRKSKTFKIQSNVPMPEPTSDPHRKYPFNEMGVGDSVYVDGKDNMRRARNASYLYGGRSAKKFTCRKIAKDRWRIWRTK